ncbi:MAG: fabF [Bryobacterales bacterium]|nr:fabF [Bryobacterales bacterium]
MERHTVALVRVAITGIGLVTPLGLCVPENVERSRRGDSAIGPIRSFDVKGHSCTSAAYVPAFDVIGWLRLPKNHKFMNHSVLCAMQAAREAINDSGINLEKLDPTRVAIYTGSGQTGIEYENYFPALEAAWDGNPGMDFKDLGGMPSHLIDRYIVLRTLSNSGLALLSSEFGMRGPSGNSVQSDTASAQALTFAYYDLVEGRCDVALAGGYDSLLGVSSFLSYQKAGLLSGSAPHEAYRPFDQRRDGLVLGAGAGFFILERWEHAEARGAVILGELCGIGCATETSDANTAVRNTETLHGAMQQAINAPDIDFVVARGIGTQEADRKEASSITSLLDIDLPVTALKSQTGYLGAATAAVELGLGLSCARYGFVPPIARHAAADPECALSLVAHQPRELDRSGTRLGLFLSYSWGGQVAAIAARAMPA